MLNYNASVCYILNNCQILRNGNGYMPYSSVSGATSFGTPSATTPHLSAHSCYIHVVPCISQAAPTLASFHRLRVAAERGSWNAGTTNVGMQVLPMLECRYYQVPVGMQVYNNISTNTNKEVSTITISTAYTGTSSTSAYGQKDLVTISTYSGTLSPQVYTGTSSSAPTATKGCCHHQCLHTGRSHHHQCLHTGRSHRHQCLPSECLRLPRDFVTTSAYGHRDFALITSYSRTLSPAPTPQGRCHHQCLHHNTAT